MAREITAEEKRKRDRRLAKKNGRPLGGAVGNPPTSRTSEYVQRSQLSPRTGAELVQAVGGYSPELGPEPQDTVS